MKITAGLLLVAVVACILVAAVLAAWTIRPSWTPGPQEPERGPLREQVWRIPDAGGSPFMLSTVMRPPGEAKAPLVVINHGAAVPAGSGY